MRVLARLEHPNIVTAHDAGVDAGVLYLAMAYLSGDSIERKLKKDGPYPEAEAVKILQGIGMPALSDMDEAVQKVVALAKAAA